MSEPYYFRQGYAQLFEAYAYDHNEKKFLRKFVFTID